MGRKCKVCGEKMKRRVGEHHGDLGQGVRLYRDVRHYACTNEECGATFYDFSRAIPHDAPVRILKFIKAPSRQINVIGPLLWTGLMASATLMILAFLFSTLNMGAKIAAVTLVIAFTVWLINFIGSSEQNGDTSTV